MLDYYNSNIFHTALSGQPQMLSIPLNSMQGYDTRGCKIHSREGHELDERYLQRYRCVHCKFILRRPYQLICGDRICKNCLPSRYVSSYPIGLNTCVCKIWRASPWCIRAGASCILCFFGVVQLLFFWFIAYSLFKELQSN